MSEAFLAGAAARSIVPTPSDFDNALHAQMSIRLDERGSPLAAKVLAMTCGSRSLMLVALDTVRIPNCSADVLRRAIGAACDLPPASIVISCSHSHSTPFVETQERHHPYFDLVRRACLEAAADACRHRRPARMGHARTHVVGASFNQRVPMPDGGVKFTRDYREGLASGRPVDPRLSLLRIDDADGRPIAGWVRFAAHPACVIFDAPISGEYPGYLTERLSASVAHGAPVLFGFGAAGDVNCVPMFGTEADSRDLGIQLADLAAPVFAAIETRAPRRMAAGHRTLDLPLDEPPSPQELDREIEEVEAFVAGLDHDPGRVWVLGTNCWKDWSVEKKKTYALPLAEWARRMKATLAEGRAVPRTWPVPVSGWVLDDLGLLFYPGEPFTEVGLAVSARGPLPETLVLSHCNGWTGYLGTDEDRRRGGYETDLWSRFFFADAGTRPLPYRIGAAGMMIEGSVSLLEQLAGDQP